MNDYFNSWKYAHGNIFGYFRRIKYVVLLEVMKAELAAIDSSVKRLENMVRHRVIQNVSELLN